MSLKSQKQSIKFMQFMHKFFYELPVYWNSAANEIYPNKERKKWRNYLAGNAVVFILWLSCVYGLSTELFFHRKTFTVIHWCTLSTGFCAFTGTLGLCRSLIALRNKEYHEAINAYIKIQQKLYSECDSNEMSRQMQLAKYDIALFSVQPAFLLPYLTYAACLFANLDGPYWVLEDIWPADATRPVSVSVLFIVIRTILIMPGFVESTRAIYVSALGNISFQLSVKSLLYVLNDKVKTSNNFFKWYNHLAILWNILEYGILQYQFAAVSIFYFLCIQDIFLGIRGFGHLEPVIYSVFFAHCLICSLGMLVLLPLLASIGQRIESLPRTVLREMKAKRSRSKTFGSLVDIKRAKALKPLKFCYGEGEKFGRNFARNCFKNILDTSISMILMFDMNGRRVL